MIPVIDMHCDTISVLYNRRLEGRETALRENDLHIDLEKMKRDGYMCQNFAFFTYLADWMPDSPQRHPCVAENCATPREYALRLSETFDAEIAKNADLIGAVTTASEIEANFAAGKLSAMKTVEEGAVYEGSAGNLKMFYDLGVRMTTLTWNFENELAFPNRIDRAHGVVEPDTVNGLKPAGKELVEACKALGIIVDIAHLNDAGIYDVFGIMGKTPFVASHSNARSVTGHARNLTDDMLKKLADCGGVTGLNFCSDFMNGRHDDFTSIDDIVRHAVHITNVAGFDVLGLGSDHDGIENRLEHADCGGMQRLADALQKAGFTEDQVEKVFYKNVLRVYREILG